MNEMEAQKNLKENKIIPEVVYHYTSMDTLLKIVRPTIGSGAKLPVFHATSVNYLNDITERTFFLEAISGRLQQPDAWGKFSVSQFELSKFFEEMEEPNAMIRDLPFVSSFSGNRDSLPQWRAYCSNGNGVAIGIRTESLINAFGGEQKGGGEHWQLRPVVSFKKVNYLSKSEAPLIDQMLSDAIAQAKDDKADVEREHEGFELHLPDSVWWRIAELASYTKDISFATEEEFRLILTNPYIGGRIHFKPSRFTLIPYAEVNLPHPTASLHSGLNAVGRLKNPYFIHEIVVGPSPHSDLSTNALNEFFGQCDLDIDIQRSEIPYRDTI
ncbi:DUF2971 domain-containing protein [Terriglobus sp. 2YAB30_2]|uniref:DUF2971 domain-containing protein n=1 Tax=unclassified Terriglobus TaxID=2628988 RepID=UPI003F9BCCAC